MRMILAAAAMAAAVGAAGVASATTFTGTYNVSGYWTNDNGGLSIDIDNGSGGFNISGLDFGESQMFTLFQIQADESVNIPSSGSDHDDTSKPINVSFTFSAPVNFPGGGSDANVGGTTVGVSGGSDDYGHLHWTAPATVNFGNLGILTITMQDTDFDTDYNANVKATFSLAAPVTAPGGGAVPEPATWGLMITGFGMAGATLRRRRTAAATA